MRPRSRFHSPPLQAARPACWALVSLALVLATSCRVRRLEQERPPQAREVAWKRIDSPDDVAPQPPPIVGQRPPQPAGLVVAVGFGDVGFAGIRQAQLEAEQLLPALEDDNPWSKLVAGLGGVAGRRWSPGEQFDKRVAISLTDGGKALLQRRTTDDLLSSAIAALGKQQSPIARDGAPSADWSLMSGPLIVVGRASDGEYGVLWLEQRRPTAPARTMSFAHRAQQDGALCVVCACETPTLAEEVASTLSETLSSPAELTVAAAELGAGLDSDGWLEGSYAIVALTDSTVVVEGTANLVQATAGYVAVPGGGTLPGTEPPKLEREPPLPTDAGVPTDAGAPRVTTQSYPTSEDAEAPLSSERQESEPRPTAAKETPAAPSPVRQSPRQEAPKPTAVPSDSAPQVSTSSAVTSQQASSAAPAPTKEALVPPTQESSR